MESTPEFQASVAVWQYCPPFLFIFGTFGNVMTVLIIRRMNMKRSSMSVYLTALAVSDTCLLYTGLSRRWIMNVFGIDLRTLHSVMCKLHTWLVYSLIIISAWILTFMTVERTLSVWKPHRVSLLCSKTKAGIIVVGIILTSLLVNSHFLYGVDVTVGKNGTGVACSAPDAHYLYFFDAVWSWVDLTLASLIPFTVLLIGNCLILWKVSLSARIARTLGSVRPNVTLRKKTTSSLTVTLVGLSIIFFLTTSPICVYNIIEHYVEQDLLSDLRGTGRLRLSWAIVNILMYTNNSVNFYLYCLSGTKFRKELRKCLCQCKAPQPPSWKNAGLHNLSNHTNHTNHNHNSHNHDSHDDSHQRRQSRCPQDQNCHCPGRGHEGCAQCHTHVSGRGREMPDGSAQSRIGNSVLHSVFYHVSENSVEF